jgi:thiol-disulfide isomerase/thioredoxin
MSCIRKYSWILLLIAGHSSPAQPSSTPPANDSVFNAAALSSFRLFDVGRHSSLHLPPAAASGYTRLFIFLSPECPLCQNYTIKLNEFYSRYGGKIKIYGIIPGSAYKPAAISAFREKYKIAYPLLIDGSLRLSHYLQASATPEVILLGPGNELIYKGAIDNWYKALGKSRIRTTENYLQDAIDRTLRQEPPAIKRTTPVGCLLNDF